MIRKPAGALFAFVALAAAAVFPAEAQDSDYPSQWAGSVVLSTLGIGGELTGRANPIVGLRGGYFLFGMSHDDTVEDIRYHLEPRLRNGTVMVDLHPGGGIFRVSGGLVFNSSRVDATGLLDGPVEIGGVEYTPDEVGTLTGRAKYEKTTMPYAGIGIASTARFSVTVDLGVAFSGYPKVRLSADSPLTGPELEALEQSLAAEEAEIQQEIESHSWAKFYPVLSIGFKFRF